jgi:hypothetical protein
MGEHVADEMMDMGTELPDEMLEGIAGGAYSSTTTNYAKDAAMAAMRSGMTRAEFMDTCSANFKAVAAREKNASGLALGFDEYMAVCSKAWNSALGF